MEHSNPPLRFQGGADDILCGTTAAGCFDSWHTHIDNAKTVELRCGFLPDHYGHLGIGANVTGEADGFEEPLPALQPKLQGERE